MKSLPAGKSFLISLALSWEESNGSVPVASEPVSVTFTDAHISVGDVVYVVTSSGIRSVGKATADGKLTVEFREDPTLVLTANPRVASWVHDSQWQGGRCH